jgi:hypothetical protein
MEIKDTFLFAVRAGLIQGHRLIHKSARNPSAGTSAEDIMFGGGILAPLTTSVTMEAISTNVNDTVAGSNARTIKITGTDDEANEISEIINMNGTTASSATTKKFLRINHSEVETVGGFNASNIGDITIRVSSGGATQQVIEAGTGKDQSSFYMIPNGETGFLVSTRIDVDSSKTAQVFFKERGNLNIGGSAPFSPVIHSQTWDALTGNKDDIYYSEHSYLSGTDIWAESIAGQANTPINFDYDLLLVKDRVLDA